MHASFDHHLRTTTACDSNSNSLGLAHLTWLGVVIGECVTGTGDCVQVLQDFVHTFRYRTGMSQILRLIIMNRDLDRRVLKSHCSEKRS
jgi:hypothetical protein